MGRKPRDPDKILKLVQAGKNMDEIVRETTLSVQAVRAALKRIGFKGNVKRAPRGTPELDLLAKLRELKAENITLKARLAKYEKESHENK